MCSNYNLHSINVRTVLVGHLALVLLEADMGLMLRFYKENKTNPKEEAGQGTW